MIRRYWSYCVDELVGYMMLRSLLRYGGHAPQVGRIAEECPDFACGDIRTLMAPAPEPADLAGEFRLVADTPDCTVRDLSFRSSVVTPFEENNRVRVRHWASKVPVVGRRPTVIGVDGLVQLGSGWFRRFAEELTPAGIDVVMMDSPYNFRRTPAGYRPGQLILRGNLDHQFDVSRQAVLDLWSLVRGLQLDEQRQIGLFGISYGGWMSLMASLLVRDLEFVVAVAPPVDILRILEEGGRIVVGLRESVGMDRLESEELQRAARGLSPLCWEPLLAAERIVLYAARYDRFVPPHRIHELSERWGTPIRVRPTGHYALTTSRRYIPGFAAEIRGLAGVSR